MKGISPKRPGKRAFLFFAVSSGLIVSDESGGEALLKGEFESVMQRFSLI
jgi:hypothetical protein